MTDPTQKQSTDNAFTGPLKGGAVEPTYGGALSFMRRRYSRDLAGVDAVVWGIPFDQATTNRPGARFGPQAIRRASAILDGDPQYPFKLDPFATLAVVDYGDAYFDYRLAYGVSLPRSRRRHATSSTAARSSFRWAAIISSPTRC